MHRKRFWLRRAGLRLLRIWKSFSDALLEHELHKAEAPPDLSEGRTSP